MNILKSFADFYSKDVSGVTENDEQSMKEACADLMNSPLYKDIATEQFYVLVKQDNGVEERMYLSNEQLRCMAG